METRQFPIVGKTKKDKVETYLRELPHVLINHSFGYSTHYLNPEKDTRGMIIVNYNLHAVIEVLTIDVPENINKSLEEMTK